MKRMTLISILALSSVLVFSGCGKKVETEATSEITPVSTEAETESTVESTTEAETVDPYFIPEGMMRSYLTGELVSSEKGLRRPVAVMLNNIINACPQTGISRAGVIYEAPVEGGLTRLMGVFEDYDDLDKIGSVRSARPYYIYFAKEYEAIYAHYGQCEFALSLLNSGVVNNLSGLEAVGNVVYYRTSDRVAPHNAYTSAEGIAEGIDYMSYDDMLPDTYTGHYKFCEGDQVTNLSEGVDAKKVVVGYAVNKPWFEYNSDDGLYYRFQYNDEQIDDMTDEQLTCKNIIMQYCSWDYYDNTEYLNINVTSGGKGMYITNGKAIDITWEKDSTYGPTRYYDANGSEIILNQGQTWVCIIQNNRVDYIELYNEID